MGDANITNMPQVGLQTAEHEELLNVIDTLRSQGISRYVDLLQLIFCGDQSSGKSVSSKPYLVSVSLPKTICALDLRPSLFSVAALRLI